MCSCQTSSYLLPSFLSMGRQTDSSWELVVKQSAASRCFAPGCVSGCACNCIRVVKKGREGFFFASCCTAAMLLLQMCYTRCHLSRAGKS